MKVKIEALKEWMDEKERRKSEIIRETIINENEPMSDTNDLMAHT